MKRLFDYKEKDENVNEIERCKRIIKQYEEIQKKRTLSEWEFTTLEIEQQKLRHLTSL